MIIINCITVIKIKIIKNYKSETNKTNKIKMELYQRFFAPHYIINFLYVLQFFVIRYVPSLGSHFLDLSLEPPEKTIYIVFLILALIKFKSSSNAEEFLSIFFVYGKFLNLVMFYWYGKTLWIILYALIWGLLFVILPQPSYRGSSKIVELTSDDLHDILHDKVPKIIELDDENNLQKGKAKEKGNAHYWVIFFYATWSAACRNFESTVAKTSLKYSSPNVQFGKIDLDCYEGVSQELDISLSPTSLDLPTLILFKNGKEIGRLPQKNRDGSVEDLDKIKNKTLRNAKVTWDRLGWDRSMKSIISTFKLETLHKSM
ncbi:hypothetical protein Glove_214g26 [Diversispora epigaea]|uniref:Thioredoxin domain-containing protein n=1 Tax=Diversispora epigaea TaxID=1348612 RepID=A0A397IKN8_9GLOM|nr:hypothetical protein Glove_214g26 [Diversispora epigaea]